MPRVNFNQVNSLPDLLDQSNFEFMMGVIPGSSDTTDLTFKCQNVSLPGFSNEAWEAMLHGYVIKFRGRVMYPRTLQATFMEDSLFRTFNKLKRWHNYIGDPTTGVSAGYKSEYSITAVLMVYDTRGFEISQIKFDGLFIQELGDAQLDGTSSAPLIISATFSYDRYLSSGTDYDSADR